MNYTLPEDFKPEYNKDFEVKENRFEVRLQNKGLVTKQNGAPVLEWIFVITVDGKPVEAGEFHWDPSERKLTDENVANHLATFYGESDQVVKANKDISQLSKLVMLCAGYATRELVPIREEVEYNVVLEKIEGDSWRIILETGAMRNRMFEFQGDKWSTRVKVTVHTAASSFFATNIY